MIKTRPATLIQYGVLMLIFLVGLPYSSQADEVEGIDDIRLFTEEFPPLNFQKEGRLQGIGVDLMVRMLKEAGAQLDRKDIALVPWPRGYKMLQEKKNTCLFSTSRTKKREALFKWVGPIAPIKNVLTARKDKEITIASVGDLKNYRIGVIRDDSAEQLLLQAGIELDHLERVSSSLQNIRKLNKGRLDLWAYNETTARWQMKEHGFQPDDYETVFTLDASGSLYFAFNKKTDDAIIQGLQGILDRLKKNGEYQKILDHYLR